MDVITCYMGWNNMLYGMRCDNMLYELNVITCYMRWDNSTINAT